MKNLTELEREVLEAIIKNDYRNGFEKECVVDIPVYVDSRDVTMNADQLSGAVSSCVKKGYAKTMRDGSLQAIWITELGWNTFYSNL